MDAFAKNIKRLRKMKSFSQAELAKELGVSKATIGLWETGVSTPTLKGLSKIADYFGIFSGTLFGNLDVDEESNFTPIPMLGSISAGMPLDMITDSSESYYVTNKLAESHPDCFMLKINGESMNKLVANGSYALIDPHAELQSMDVAAVAVNGSEATLKRVQFLNNGLKLIPESYDPTFVPEVYNYNEDGTPKVNLIGKLIWDVKPYDFKY